MAGKIMRKQDVIIDQRQLSASPLSPQHVNDVRPDRTNPEDKDAIGYHFRIEQTARIPSGKGNHQVCWDKAQILQSCGINVLRECLTEDWRFAVASTFPENQPQELAEIAYVLPFEKEGEGLRTPNGVRNHKTKHEPATIERLERLTLQSHSSALEMCTQDAI